MRGFLNGGLKGDHAIAAEFYQKAIDAIRKIRLLFEDVPDGTRGSTFKESFLFGVQSLQQQSLVEVSLSSYESNGRVARAYSVRRLFKSQAEKIRASLWKCWKRQPIDCILMLKVLVENWASWEREC